MKNVTARGAIEKTIAKNNSAGVISNHPRAVEESISARDYLNTVTSPR